MNFYLGRRSLHVVIVVGGDIHTMYDQCDRRDVRRYEGGAFKGTEENMMAEGRERGDGGGGV